MPLLFDVKEFKKTCPKGRLLGIDVGTKTFGLALCDETRLVASSFQTIHRKKWQQDQQRLMNILDDFSIQGLVVGWPLNMNGTQGPRCQATQDVVTNLLTLQDLPCLLWDERLSTMAITRTLLEADVSRKKRKQVVDSLAAAYILQGCLDALGRC